MVFHFTDGSIASFDYFSNGAKTLSKELVEIHCNGSSIILEDFKEIRGFGISANMKTGSQEKGHREELEALYHTLSRETFEWPISLESMLDTTEMTFRLIE